MGPSNRRDAGRCRPTTVARGIVALAVGAVALLTFGGGADAAIVPTVRLGTAANYNVLGASTVTNTGPTTLDLSLGLFPGTSISGFPPGRVNPPGTTDTTNAAAAQGQAALTAAYVNAAGRPVNGTTTAALDNLHLQAGVYSGPSKSPLSLTGPLVLDGAGNRNSVFIFQTDSSLTTASRSTVTLVNGAQECNVFWQVGSSATLGTGSVFRGNILAQISVTVTSGVTVHGRALARTGAVTLDTDTFVPPTCAVGVPPATTTTTTTTGGSATTTPTGGSATTTPTGGWATTSPTGGSGPSSPTGGSGPSSPTGGSGPASPTGGDTDLTSAGRSGPGVPGVNGPPRTGATPRPATRSPWDDITRMAVALGAAAASWTLLRGLRRPCTSGGSGTR